jgi:hypothetical protein
VFQESTARLLREVPAAIKETGVEALLVDETTSAGGTVAEFLGIPFVTVCSALVLNQEDAIPPFFTPWSYNSAWWALLRNRAGYSLFRRIAQPIREVIADYRQQWKLPHTPVLTILTPNWRSLVSSQQNLSFLALLCLGGSISRDLTMTPQDGKPLISRLTS